jgi:hypothetical protein
VINDLQRLLHLFRRSTASPLPSARDIDLPRLRSALLESVKDCRDMPALRLHARITRANTAQDLWILRADAHDVIARHHCQAIAEQRIRCLEPLREGRNP